uniref:Uncharacterized protein n=1 Tax=Trichuris muris TaxID=70415 RepID=A0A5S6Q979_TRIMR
MNRKNSVTYWSAQKGGTSLFCDNNDPYFCDIHTGVVIEAAVVHDEQSPCCSNCPMAVGETYSDEHGDLFITAHEEVPTRLQGEHPKMAFVAQIDSAD